MLWVLLSAVSFLIGVWAATLFLPSLPVWFFGLAIVMMNRNRKVALLFLLFLLGCLRVDIYEKQLFISVPFEKWDRYEGEVTQVDERLDQKKVTVRSTWGKFLVNISLYEDVWVGDWMVLEGFLERPFEKGVFSYKNYLARYGIAAVLNRPEILTHHAGKFSVRRALFSFQQILQKRIQSLYFEPEASFVSGLLLGSRKGMPDDLTDAFQSVGLLHTVAISGYNMSLIVAATFHVFGFLPFRRRLLFSIVAVVFFVILIGASAAALRAGLMACITMWGLYTGRKSQAVFALLWAGVLMILWNPYILAYDIGFQLSYASTAGLMVFSTWINGKSFLKEALAMTLSAQIATLPFMLYYFGQVSFVAPLANILVAPLLPLAMLFSGLSLVFGPYAAFFAHPVLKSIETVAFILAQFPFAQMEVSVSVFIFSGLLFLWIILPVLFYKSKWERAFFL